MDPLLSGIYRSGGTHVISGSKDGTVRVWELGEPGRGWIVDAPDQTVRAVNVMRKAAISRKEHGVSLDMGKIEYLV